MMKLAFIGPWNSIHFHRRTNWFAKRGHDVLILSYKWPEGPNYHPNARLELFDFEAGKSDPMAMLEWAESLMREFLPDVLHVHKCDYPGVFGLFMNYHPMVFTMWDGIHLRDPRLNKSARKLVPFAGKNADLITANSPGLLREAVAAGVPEEKTMLTSWGVDRDLFSLKGQGNENTVDDLRQRYGITPEHKVIFSSRAMAPFSNLDILAQAMDMTASTHDRPLKFLFASYVATRDTAWQMANVLPKLKHRDDFIWCGHVTDQRELAAHYQISDVVASLYWGYLESSPASIIEGMLCGAIPVVADLPVLDFWVKHGVNGQICQPRDPGEVSRCLLEALKMSENDSVIERNRDKARIQADYPATMAMMESTYKKLAQEIAPGFAPGNLRKRVTDIDLMTKSLNQKCPGERTWKNPDAVNAYRQHLEVGTLSVPPSGDVREYVLAATLERESDLERVNTWLTDLSNVFHYDLGYLTALFMDGRKPGSLEREYLMQFQPIHAGLLPLYREAGPAGKFRRLQEQALKQADPWFDSYFVK